MSPKRPEESSRRRHQDAPEDKPKLAAPKLYKVLLHNDDYTPMEFVVLVLMQVFHKSESDSASIMLHAHTHGYAWRACTRFEIAETKVNETMALPARRSFRCCARWSRTERRPADASPARSCTSRRSRWCTPPGSA